MTVTVIEVPGTDVDGVGAPVPDGDELVVAYSQQFWPLTGWRSESLGDSVRGGVMALHTSIASVSGARLVVSNSQGGLVAHAVQNDLVDDPGAPPADQMSFTYYGDPLQPRSGFFSVLRVPVPGPGSWYVPRAAKPSQYATRFVAKQYDMAGDFPNRPWNLVAVLNALLGFWRGWHWYGDVNLSDPKNLVTTKGNCIFVLVPSDFLPLTRPLRTLGFDTAAVDAVLRPIVDRGYNRQSVR